jgi:hypothetical protein
MKDNRSKGPAGPFDLSGLFVAACLPVDTMMHLQFKPFNTCRLSGVYCFVHGSNLYMAPFRRSYVLRS